jgi:hypothetical protein
MAEHHTPRTPDPSTAQSRSPLTRKQSRFVVAAVLLVGTAGLLAMVSGAFGGGDDDARIVVDERERSIQLDVVNAAGTSRLAQKLTEYLRSKGFDVVEIGTLRDQLEKTLVIDRSGNAGAALRVAEAIGVLPDQVVQKIDRNLYLDVSVFIGKDYQTLKPFR